MKNLSFGLLQCRNPGDSMLEHEVACFQEALELARSQILPLNIVDAQPHTGLLDEVDVILVGGAGDYSVLDRSEFLPPFFQLSSKFVSVAFLLLLRVLVFKPCAWRWAEKLSKTWKTRKSARSNCA